MIKTIAMLIAGLSVLVSAIYIGAGEPWGAVPEFVYVAAGVSGGWVIGNSY